MTGDDLKQWRRRENIKVTDLARIVGRSKRTLFAYEAAELLIPQYIMLALTALGYPRRYSPPRI